MGILFQKGGHCTSAQKCCAGLNGSSGHQNFESREGGPRAFRLAGMVALTGRGNKEKTEAGGSLNAQIKLFEVGEVDPN